MFYSEWVFILTEVGEHKRQCQWKISEALLYIHACIQSKRQTSWLCLLPMGCYEVFFLTTNEHFSFFSHRVVSEHNTWNRHFPWENCCAYHPWETKQGKTQLQAQLKAQQWLKCQMLTGQPFRETPLEIFHLLSTQHHQSSPTQGAL